MTERLISKSLAAPAHFDDADIEQWQQLIDRVHKANDFENDTQAERDRRAGEKRRLAKAESRRQMSELIEAQKRETENKTMTRDEAYAAIQTGAAAIRKAGEPHAVAAARFMTTTDEGRALTIQANAQPETVAKSDDSVDALILASVKKLQQQTPGVSFDAAYALWLETPQAALLLKAASPARAGSSTPRLVAELEPRVTGAFDAFAVNDPRFVLAMNAGLISEARASLMTTEEALNYIESMRLAVQRADMKSGAGRRADRVSAPYSPRMSSPGRQ